MAETVALVVPLGESFGAFDQESFGAGLARYPWLELVIAGHEAQRQVVQAFGEHAGRVRFIAVEGPESHIVQAGMNAALALDVPFAGYWGPDCEAPLETLDVWRQQLQSSELLMMFGSRLRLVQNQHPGLWTRHYAGRVLASAVSLLLKLEAYDTECCAKLFRNNAVSRSLFATPFETSVCFDIEVFVRLVEQEAADPSFRVNRDCLEYPLRSWRKRARPRYSTTINMLLVATDLIRLRQRVGRLDRHWE